MLVRFTPMQLKKLKDFLNYGNFRMSGKDIILFQEILKALDEAIDEKPTQQTNIPVPRPPFKKVEERWTEQIDNTPQPPKTRYQEPIQSKPAAQLKKEKPKSLLANLLSHHVQEQYEEPEPEDQQEEPIEDIYQDMVNTNSHDIDIDSIETSAIIDRRTKR